MQADFIFVAEGGRNSALRKLRAGIFHFALRQHLNAARGSELDRRAQSGNPGANDQEIRLRWSGWHCRNGITANRAHSTKAVKRAMIVNRRRIQGGNNGALTEA